MKKKDGESKEIARIEKGQDSQGSWDDLGDLEDLLGTNEEEQMIEFQCMNCGAIDEVPEFIIGEFSYDLEEGEEVEMYCPECNGTTRRKR